VPRLQESWLHTLAFAARFDDHFFGRAVPDALVVRVDGTGAPVATAGGVARQDDGTYRFIDLAPGSHVLEVFSPDERWVSFGGAITIDTPIASPGSPVVYELWPGPTAPTPLGATAVRGHLGGTDAGGLAIEILPVTATPPVFSGRPFTRSNAAGEFLFLVTGTLTPDSDGRVRVRARVANGTRTIANIVLPATGEVFLGSDFWIKPGADTRAQLNLT
jgi:hypothetical protein